MSRLHLTEEQVDQLDMDTLEELRHELNDELALLADVEKSIYKRRRFLEVEAHPELMEDDFYQEPPPIPSKPPKLSASDLLEMIRRSGISPQDLKQFIK